MVARLQPKKKSAHESVKKSAQHDRPDTDIYTKDNFFSTQNARDTNLHIDFLLSGWSFLYFSQY